MVQFCYSATGLNYRGHPTNFFGKLANQDIFLLVHKIQNDMSSIIRCRVTCLLDFARRRDSYSQPRSRVNRISKNEMNIRISLCNVRRVNGMLDISLKTVPKKTH